MAAKQGRSNQILDGANGTAVTSAMFALGAGWAGGATIAVTAGSTQWRGTAVITAKTTTPAQATATVIFTFPDPFAAAPFVMTTTTNDNSLTAASAFANTTVTTTAVTWTHSILPVDTKLYTINWIIVG